MKKVLGLSILIALAAAAGYFLRSFLGDGGGAGEAGAVQTSGKGETWTCSMHPQVRLPKPVPCPICSMPLVSADSLAGQPSGDEAPVLELSEAAKALARVETVSIERRALEREIRAVGKVQFNETALANITARVEGYVERLFVDFTGVEVNPGDHLVEIYSPDLVVAQQELLLALQSGAGPSLIESAKTKLRLWELTPEQIDDLVQHRKLSERLTLYSPIHGTVIEKMVVQKSRVKPGDVLYRLANLESVWVYLDIYEYELASVRYGQPVEVTTEAFPGTVFIARVWFINPVLTDESRTVKVLVNIANPDRRLKPGMFVNAIIRASLQSDGQPAPTGLEGQWTCIMHPQVHEPQTGACPLCQMALRQIPLTPLAQGTNDHTVLAVPVSAVLDSGLRRLVYVERFGSEYAPVEVALGPRAGDYYPVLGGLKEHDQVVVRGNFLLDSQFQIRGLPSLLFQRGQTQDAAAAAAHAAHGGHGEARGVENRPAAAPPAERHPDHPAPAVPATPLPQPQP